MTCFSFLAIFLGLQCSHTIAAVFESAWFLVGLLKFLPVSLSTEEFNSAFLLHLNALSKSSRDEMLMELGNQNVIAIYFSNNLKISCHILNFTSFGKNTDFSCDPCLFIRYFFFFCPFCVIVGGPVTILLLKFVKKVKS